MTKIKDKPSVDTAKKEAPSKEKKSTKAPSKEKKSTKAPSKEKKSTKAPSKEKKSTKAPSKEKKSTKAPSKEKKSTKAPSKEKKSTKAPSKEKKSTKKVLPKEKKLTKKELEEIKKEAEKTLEEELEEQLTDEEIENFQIEKVDMERLTNKICDVLAERESDGMFQSELWKKLKLTSRDGSRLALKLERMGTIYREKILDKGRWTYKLILKKTPISTLSIENAPCLVCPVEQKCSLEGEISPRNCQFIEDWVLADMKKTCESQMKLIDARRDQYRKLAHEQGFRSRAAYKLKQLNQSYRIIGPGFYVLDLGCAPGGWTQMAVKLVGNKGKVMGIDTSYVEEIPGAHIIRENIENEFVIDEILSYFERKVNAVICDLSPQVTGNWSVDHAIQVSLNYECAKIMDKVLMHKGNAIFKVFDGEYSMEFKDYIKKKFSRINLTKPEASRKQSSELYYVCLGFTG